MFTHQSTPKLLFCVILTILMFVQAMGEQKSHEHSSSSEGIKSYCIDFNWAPGRRSGFAKPGMWNAADPAATVEWHKKVGSNVIQTFAVSCNGYAWYKGGVVPEQPGLKHDFLKEVVKLGHAEGMKVMGYFCIAANTRWGKENPDLSYGTPSGYHLPFTDEYLEYLDQAIFDAVKTTGMDGFMIDWVWMPRRGSTKGKWIESEKKLYRQLMGEEFPGEDKLTKEQDKAYSIKAIDRCWQTIRKSAKRADPDCVIWLTTNKMNLGAGLAPNMYKQVGWLMGEAGNLSEIIAARSSVSKDCKLITCMALWNGADATKEVPLALEAGVGLYGFAKPNLNNGTIDLERILPKQLSELSGDAKSIGALARAYHGKSAHAEWAGNTFVEPETPPYFTIEFRGRKGWHDTAHVSHGESQSLVRVHSPYQTGRANLVRAGDAWPDSLTIQILRKKENVPMPTHFRITNGEVGVAVSHADGMKVVAGNFDGSISIKSIWTAQKFLNGGKPDVPAKVGEVQTRLTDGFLEFVVPMVMTKSNPEVLAIEWCKGDKVR